MRCIVNIIKTMDDRTRELRIYVACIDKIRYWKARIISQAEDLRSRVRCPSGVRPPANNTPFTLTESHTPESKVVAPCEK